MGYWGTSGLIPKQMSDLQIVRRVMEQDHLIPPPLQTMLGPQLEAASSLWSLSGLGMKINICTTQFPYWGYKFRKGTF